MADQVFLDDVIVDGSLCAGLDCINGENFGFDTFRLKENNLRIHFDDTSASASFPANDWRIAINGSNNGDPNFFAIEDATGARTPFRIDAGAGNNSLYIASSGHVGFGTSTPAVDLHALSGNTPTLRLQQDGTAGFAPQTFDIAANETNFFIRDAANGGTLPFRIRPGAPTSAIDIASTGRIGVGTSSPDAALHVTAQGGKAAVLLDGGTASTPNDSKWEFSVRNSDGEFAINDVNTPGGDFIFKSADDDRNSPWEFVHRGDEGFGINTQTTNGAEFILSTQGDLRVSGSITSSGPTCSSGCDAVFDDDYPLPTIADHAEEMFARRHLPAVGPTSPEQPINLTDYMGNVLNELEKAHIFIAQLDKRNKALEARIAELESANE